MITSVSSVLSGMGFYPGEVVEVILTTISEEGQPNAAPMGVWVQPGPELVIKPYPDTQTAHNLTNIPEAVINITDDPRMFFNTAFKQETSSEESFLFEATQQVRPPQLRGMQAYIAVTVEPSVTDRTVHEPLEFKCQVQYITAPAQPPAVFSRARCAAIECVIHATRIRILHDIDPVAIEELMETIQKHHNFVQRIAPDSISARVIDDVLELIQQWVYWL